MTMRNVTLPILGMLWLAACEDTPTELECENSTAVVTGQVTSGETAQVVSRDLTVRGTAQHGGNLTIRQVLVAGIPATNGGFNFETWSAIVPVGALAALPVGEDGRSTVEVKATDACLRTHTLTTFAVRVDPNPEVEVQSLDLGVTLPGSESYLPATGSIPAVLTLTANAEAANATVTLTAPLGTFQGTNNNQLLLAGDRQSPARGNALFIPGAPGTVVITATAKERTDVATVKVAGPPKLVPSGATLAPGQTVRVTVLTEGRIAACQATPAAGLTVTSGTVDLTSTPGAEDVTQDGFIDIDVSAASDAATAASASISCRDPYGQSVTGTFALAP